MIPIANLYLTAVKNLSKICPYVLNKTINIYPDEKPRKCRDANRFVYYHHHHHHHHHYYYH